MKKIISIKIISLLIIAILSISLKSCREYGEDMYPEKNVPTENMKNIKNQLKAEQDTSSSPGEPPVKIGTHWKLKKQ